MKRVRQLAAVLILFGFSIIPSSCAYVGNPETSATRFGQAGEQGEEAKSTEGDGDNAPAAVATNVRTGMRSLRISVPYSQIDETTKTEWRLKMEKIMRQDKKAKATMNERYARNRGATGILNQRRRRQQPVPNCDVVPYEDENGDLAYSISCPGLTPDQVDEHLRQNGKEIADELGISEDQLHVGYPPTTSLTTAVETSSAQASAAVETSTTQASAAVETSTTQASTAVETSSTQASAAVETNSTQASSGIAEKVVVASHVPDSSKDKTERNVGIIFTIVVAAIFVFCAICALLYYICTYQEKPPYLRSNALTEGEWNSAFKSDDETVKGKAPTREQKRENRAATSNEGGQHISKKDELSPTEKRGVEDTKL